MSTTHGRDRLLITATVLVVTAVALYVVAFWPTITGEASNACEGRDFDRALWPPGGDCGDASWRQFEWPWADTAVLVVLVISVVLGIAAFARRGSLR